VASHLVYAVERHIRTHSLVTRIGLPAGVRFWTCRPSIGGHGQQPNGGYRQLTFAMSRGILGGARR